MTFSFVTRQGKILLVLTLIIPLILLDLPLVSASEIIFKPNQLINISTIECFELNNSLCSAGVICNLTMQNSSGDFLFLDIIMSPLDNGFRHLNTNLTFAVETELPSVVHCNNGGVKSFIVVVEFDEDEVDLTYYLNGFLLVTATTFFILGLKKDRFIYKIFSGFFLLFLGMEIMLNGFPNITSSYLTEGTGILLIGLGAFFVLHDVSRLGGLFE